MSTGVVKFYSAERQFGFIRPAEGGADVFFHISACAEEDDEPAVGKSVSFDVGTDPKSGKIKAVSVDLA